MKPTFGKKNITVGAMEARAPLASREAWAWGTARDWTGPLAIVTPAIRASVARLVAG